MKFVLMVAGEASADQYGARLVKEILLRDPDVIFWGIGGKKMAGAGVRILFTSEEMAVVGLTEVVPRIAKIFTAARRLQRIVKEKRPDLLILLDYPDFNIHLAGTAARSGIPVLYYISPQVWAWRKGRVRKIRKRVDRMAVILPFEELFYREKGVSVEYVGHPILDIWPGSSGVHPASSTTVSRVPLLGLVPGSRSEEVHSLLPAMLSAAALLKKSNPDLRCVLPLAQTVDEGMVKQFIAGSSVPVVLSRKGMYDTLQGCDAVIATSGTVTLEIALMGIPMVVVYRLSRLSYEVGKRIIKVPHISLVNLVAGKKVVTELIQDEANPEKMAFETEPLLRDTDARVQMVQDLEMVGKRLGEKGASARTAEIALEMMR
ncbi:MAG: lipid-A-disaccharide synthase [Deltaproteobacteria bacterium]|nr:lipid-A-disaccharide synthase [Deltaproteobacteria bacterium]